MWRMFVLLLLACLVVLVPVSTTSAQDDGGGGFGSWFQWIIDEVQEWVQAMFCRFRLAAFNAIGRWFCLECTVGTVAPGEIPDGEGPPVGGGGGAACRDIEGCECALCPGWLSQYKEYISTATGWIIEAGNFLSKFIPWQLWAALYTAYLNVVLLMWVIRLVTKFGMMFFGRVM